MSRLCTHLFMLKELNVQNGVREKLEGSGFEHYLDISDAAAHCHPLVDALVDTYSKESGCFEIGGNNLYFSLLDVLNIMGFPIVGKPVTGKKLNAVDMCKLHFNNCEGMVIGKGLKLISLRNIANSEDTVLHSVEMRTKATILYLIGTFLLPDTSGTSVKPMYCSFLDDIDNIKDYAWGAAAHAMLHSSLSGKNKSTSGCGFALAIFALIHIPQLVSSIDYKLDEQPPTFPLVKGWIKALNKTSRSGQRDISKENLTRILSDLTEDSFEWKPYQKLYNLSDDLYPKRYRDQIVLGISPIYSFHFWIRVLNATFNAAHQFDMTVDTAEGRRFDFLDGDILKEQLGLHGPSIRDYNDLWKADIEANTKAVSQVLQTPDPQAPDPQAPGPQPSGPQAPGSTNPSSPSCSGFNNIVNFCNDDDPSSSGRMGSNDDDNPPLIPSDNPPLLPDDDLIPADTTNATDCEPPIEGLPYNEDGHCTPDNRHSLDKEVDGKDGEDDDEDQEDDNEDKNDDEDQEDAVAADGTMTMRRKRITRGSKPPKYSDPWKGHKRKKRQYKKQR